MNMVRGKKIGSKSVGLKKYFIPCELESADYSQAVKKYFPLQLLGYVLQHVLSEDLKALLIFFP